MAVITGSYLTVSEVASAMRISKQTIYRLAARGEFPIMRVGARYLVPEESYKKWLEIKEKEGAGKCVNLKRG